MRLRTVTATRYVTPLREGGSLPAVVEADDDGLYVLKFRGAGQGRRALVAELLAGEIGRALGLPVPEIVFVDLDPELARTEPDPEIQDLIRASAGLNLALDYLPGSITFDPLADQPDAQLASRVVWFDAYLTNVDRTARNTNILVWHRRLWLIDHGAALYFHHSWDDYAARARSPFKQVKDHVLLPFAAALDEADAELGERLTPALVEAAVGLIPDGWLGDEPRFTGVAAHRAAYAEYLMSRLQRPRAFLEEATSADLCPYDYAVIRVVPRVERGEFVNVGVILSCRGRAFLAARFHVDAARLAALAPTLDPRDVQKHLDSFQKVCAGGPDAGPIGRLTPRERFDWLVAPRSTIIQTSPAHAGLCADPETELDHLLETMVRTPV